MDHLKDSLGRKVETIETETRKMDNTLFQQEDLNFHENSSWPSTWMVKLEPKHLATVPCLEIFIEG